MEKSLSLKRFPAPAIDKFLFMVRTLHDCQSRCVITFANRIDESRLSRAMRMSLDAEPILGCRFVDHPLKPFWERREDLHQIAICPVIVPTDLDKACQEFLAEPLDPCTDPQIQMRLFRTELDTLCIKMNHMVVDAGGLIEYVHLLGQLYKQIGSHQADVAALNRGGDRGQGQVLRHIPVRKVLTSFFYSRMPDSGLGFPMTGTDRSGRSFIKHTITAERIAAIKRYCREHQVTMNDVLHTACFRALFEVLDPPAHQPLPLQATLNMRQYLPAGRTNALCNLVGIFFPAVMREPGASFEKTLKHVHEELQKEKTRQSWIAASVLLEFGFIFGFAAAKRITHFVLGRISDEKTHHPAFANIGHLSEEQIDFGEVGCSDFVMYGPIPFPPASILSVNSYRDSMHITTGFCHSATDALLHEKLVQQFVAELPSG